MQSHNVPHRLAVRGTALVGGVLAVKAASVGCARVFGQRTDGAVETEGVEEGEQEQEAHNAENDHNQDGVHLHVHLLPWEQRGGAEEAGGRRGRVETGWRRPHGGQGGDSRHDGKPRWLCGSALWRKKYVV